MITNRDVCQHQKKHTHGFVVVTKLDARVRELTKWAKELKLYVDRRIENVDDEYTEFGLYISRDFQQKIRVAERKKYTI